MVGTQQRSIDVFHSTAPGPPLRANISCPPAHWPFLVSGQPPAALEFEHQASATAWHAADGGAAATAAAVWVDDSSSTAVGRSIASVDAMGVPMSRPMVPWCKAKSVGGARCGVQLTKFL